MLEGLTQRGFSSRNLTKTSQGSRKGLGALSRGGTHMTQRPAIVDLSMSGHDMFVSKQTTGLVKPGYVLHSTKNFHRDGQLPFDHEKNLINRNFFLTKVRSKMRRDWEVEQANRNKPPPEPPSVFFNPTAHLNSVDTLLSKPDYQEIKKR